jgi:hypothetical protein
MQFAGECDVDLTAVVHAVLWTALIADSSAEEGRTEAVSACEWY